MAENRITFTFEFNDKGKVKVDGLSKSYVKLETAMKKVNAEYKRQQTEAAKTNSGLNTTITNAGLAGATLTELGRTISDLPYGIRGVANNLSQLSTLFITFVSKVDSSVVGISRITTAFKMLGAQLKGPLGFILLFQSVIAFLDYFSGSSKKAAEKADDLTTSFDNLLTTLNAIQSTALGIFGEEKGLLTVGGTRTKALRQEFKDFDKAVKLLEKSGKLNNKTLTETFFKYADLLRIQKEIAELEKTRPTLKDQEDIIELDTKRTILLAKLYDLNQLLFNQGGTNAKTTERFKQFVAISIEELAAIFRDGIGLDVSLVDLFGISADKAAEDDKKFQKWLNDNVPEYIDDVEDFVDTQLLNEGRHTLTEMLLGLTPDSRERELKALDDRFDEILHKTEEFEKAKDAINKKWDHIELMANLKHSQALLGNLSDFLDSAAQLNEGNKELAKASIIANGAAASIGIWASYFDLKTPEKGGLALAGTFVAQAALIASTAAALKSLNSNTALSAAGAAGGGGGAESPIFNVVGQSNVDQLGRSIAAARQEPLKAYVVGNEITNQQELDNKVIQAATLG